MMKIFEFLIKPAAYRIVSDEYQGFEVQYREEGFCKNWKMPSTNTRPSIEEAKKYIEEHKMKIAKEKARGKVLYFEEINK